jgi:hypothetical protein
VTFANLSVLAKIGSDKTKDRDDGLSGKAYRHILYEVFLILHRFEAYTNSESTRIQTVSLDSLLDAADATNVKKRPHSRQGPPYNI